MRFKKLRFGKKGVSPVIATLLMIAIAVAAGILVYVWSMGLVGTLQAGGGEQTKEQIMLEAYDWSTTPTPLILYLRNTGNTEVTIANVYVEGVQNAVGPISIDVPGTGSELATVSCASVPTGLVDGQSYTVKVISSSGAVFTFSVVAGRAG